MHFTCMQKSADFVKLLRGIVAARIFRGHVMSLLQGAAGAASESITVKRRIALAQLWPTHVKTFIDSYVGLRSVDRFIRPKTVVVIMDILRFYDP